MGSQQAVTSGSGWGILLVLTNLQSLGLETMISSPYPPWARTECLTGRCSSLHSKDGPLKSPVSPFHPYCLPFSQFSFPEPSWPPLVLVNPGPRVSEKRCMQRGSSLTMGPPFLPAPPPCAVAGSDLWVAGLKTVEELHLQPHVSEYSSSNCSTSVVDLT